MSGPANSFTRRFRNADEKRKTFDLRLTRGNFLLALCVKF